MIDGVTRSLPYQNSSNVGLEGACTAGTRAVQQGDTLDDDDGDDDDFKAYLHLLPVLLDRIKTNYKLHTRGHAT